MKNAFIVLNPVAGSADRDSIRQALDEHLGGQGWQYQIYETSGQEKVRQVVREALTTGVDLAVAAGGDGTVAGVASGLVGREVPLGILPVGTGNALARHLGIPLEVEAACRLLASGAARQTVDTLQVGDRYFLLAVTVGLTALTMADTARRHKRRFGRLAYIWTGLQHLMSLSLWRFRLTVEGEPFPVRATEVACTNAPILGQEGLQWDPRVRMDDGRMDLCLVRVASLKETLRLAGGLLTGRQRQISEVDCIQIEGAVQLASRRPLPVQGDGEIIGHTPVEVRLVPRALQILVPEN